MAELVAQTEPFGEPVVIRYDGLDAAEHVVELRALAQSLQGLSRIISASAHFAITEKVSTRRDTQDVRIVVTAPRDGCFIISLVVQYAHHHPLITTIATGALANLFSAAIAYVFGRSLYKRDEMKHISAALEHAITELGSRDRPTIERLLDTVDKMADALAPAVKQAVAPVGVSARTMTVGLPSRPQENTIIDEAAKDVIMSEASLRVGEEKAYDVLISELDMVSGACHVHLAGEPEKDRHAATITDPEVQLPNNAYVTAMAAKTRLGVQAKATLREGEIDRLYISNHDGRERGDPDFQLA